MTAHEQGARTVLHRWLQDPEKAAFAINSISQISRGRFADSELAAVMGVGWWGGRGIAGLAPEQMLMTMFTHVDVCRGDILRTKVRAASDPSGDRFREENARALADLPHPFTAYVSESQHGGDCDGWLEWSEPVEASVCTEETFVDVSGRSGNVQVITTVEPMRVPLEIGSTLPSRTRLHMVESHGVARWPYGHDWVYVWVAPTGLGVYDNPLGRPRHNLDRAPAAYLSAG